VKTPPELQYLVTDMFESIVLYENKTVRAVATPEPGNKIQVTLTVKRKADGSGNEAPMALNDLIDVGVFSGTKEYLKPLHMEKQWFKTDRSTVAFIVDEKSTFAGIDPYNKLIDRNEWRAARRTDNLLQPFKYLRGGYRFRDGKRPFHRVSFVCRDRARTRKAFLS